MFTYFGQITWNSYKIFLPIFAVYILYKRIHYIRLTKKQKKLIFIFTLFSIAFIISSFLNNDYILLFLNQYSRYLIPFLALLFIPIYKNTHPNTDNYIENLIKKLLDFQIILSGINFLLLGLHENIVGSISSNGGSAATLLPVLGVLFIWQRKKRKFEKKDWFYIVGFLFIGFVSMKRAIWIITPGIIFLLMYYVPRKRLNKSIFLLLPLFPLIFYLGLRLNPTFNKEQKVWGSFNFDYFYNYAYKYTFGEKETKSIGVGRGGATFLTFNSIFNSDQELSLFGNGLLNMYGVGIDADEKHNAVMRISQLNSVTMATGFFQNYYTGGIIGVIFFLMYIFTVISLTKNKRLRIVLSLFFLWEYFLYANALIRIPALSFLFFYLIYKSSFSTISYAVDRQLLQAKVHHSLS